MLSSELTCRRNEPPDEGPTDMRRCVCAVSASLPQRANTRRWAYSKTWLDEDRPCDLLVLFLGVGVKQPEQFALRCCFLHQKDLGQATFGSHASALFHPYLRLRQIEQRFSKAH